MKRGGLRVISNFIYLRGIICYLITDYYMDYYDTATLWNHVEYIYLREVQENIKDIQYLICLILGANKIDTTFEF